MILRDLVGTPIWLASRAAWNVMECYRCAANQVLTYLILNFRLLHWVVLLGQKTNCVTIASASQNVDCCGPLSNVGREGAWKISVFLLRAIQFPFALALQALLAPLLYHSNRLAHSIKVPQSIFQEIENERCVAGSDAGADSIALLFWFFTMQWSLMFKWI